MFHSYVNTTMSSVLTTFAFSVKSDRRVLDPSKKAKEMPAVWSIGQSASSWCNSNWSIDRLHRIASIDVFGYEGDSAEPTCHVQPSIFVRSFVHSFGNESHNYNYFQICCYFVAVILLYFMNFLLTLFGCCCKTKQTNGQEGNVNRHYLYAQRFLIRFLNSHKAVAVVLVLVVVAVVVSD